MSFSLSQVPHRRFNPLSGEWVLVSPHRLLRPWQGKMESLPADNRPAHDPECYLCPGNARAGGIRNPDYSEPFVFTNDFAALLPDAEPGEIVEGGLLVARAERGTCRVVCFSPRHDLTLAEMERPAIRLVVDTWIREFIALSQAPDIGYIQIFENKGAIMGCSNPHPHGQIWATESIPVEVEKEDTQLRNHFEKHGRSLLSDYLELELTREERIVCTNDTWAALVPWWAKWPFETIVIPRRQSGAITELANEEKDGLADILKRLTTRYDNVFQVSFPYTMGFHQAPVLKGDWRHWHLHLHFYPPLLRSATVQKFMVGFEMLATPQRDLTPEQAAERLRAMPESHGGTPDTQ